MTSTENIALIEEKERAKAEREKAKEERKRAREDQGRAKAAQGKRLNAVVKQMLTHASTAEVIEKLSFHLCYMENG